MIKDKDKTCTNCIWLRTDGKSNDTLIQVVNKPNIPYACYYNGIFRMWLDKKKAEMFPICLLQSASEKLKFTNAKWSDSYANI